MILHISGSLQQELYDVILDVLYSNVLVVRDFKLSEFTDTSGW